MSDTIPPKVLPEQQTAAAVYRRLGCGSGPDTEIIRKFINAARMQGRSEGAQEALTQSAQREAALVGALTKVERESARYCRYCRGDIMICDKSTVIECQNRSARATLSNISDAAAKIVRAIEAAREVDQTWFTNNEPDEKDCRALHNALSALTFSKDTALIAEIEGEA